MDRKPRSYSAYPFVQLQTTDVVCGVRCVMCGNAHRLMLLEEGMNPRAVEVAGALERVCGGY